MIWERCPSFSLDESSHAFDTVFDEVVHKGLPPLLRGGEFEVRPHITEGCIRSDERVRGARRSHIYTFSMSRTDVWVKGGGVEGCGWSGWGVARAQVHV